MALRYLVTGCAGFIAARTAELLLDAGHQVLGIDNLNDAYSTALKRWRLARLEGRTNFEFQPLDVSDGAAMEMLAGRAAGASPASTPAFAAVLHLAARSGVRASANDPQLYLATNVVGTQHVLELCRRLAISKFVLASSSSVYGAASPVPYREDADISRPASPYAASKGAAEMLAHAAHVVHGLDVSVLRYFTVYGPAGRPDMSVFRFLKAIDASLPLTVYGDGSQSRDFTYVDDIAAGTLAALKPVGYRAFNLGGNAPCSVRDLIARASEVVGKPTRIVHEAAHPADVPATWASIDRARQELGWAPKVALAEGLRKSYAWYQAERAWAKEIEG